MNFKKIIILTMILLSVFLITSVSASDSADIINKESDSRTDVISSIENNDINNSLKTTLGDVKLSSSASKSKITPKFTAKKTTFKTKVKSKKYSVVLKADKKVVKNVRVYLTIKGSKYKKVFKATTNKKGKATFKVTKLTKKGSYTATLKFKGNKNYNSATAKIKIKITKNKCEFKAPSSSSAGSDNFVDASDAYRSLNAFRTQKGVWYWNEDDTTKTVLNTNSANTLKSLSRDADLEQTAKIRAKEIAEKFSHTRPNGLDCFSVYPNDLWVYGENIAYGVLSGSEVTELWKENSYMYDGQGHRRNMLFSDFNCVGIAGYEKNGVIYWVQAFGLKK